MVSVRFQTNFRAVCLEFEREPMPIQILAVVRVLPHEIFTQNLILLLFASVQQVVVFLVNQVNAASLIQTPSRRQ